MSHDNQILASHSADASGKNPLPRPLPDYRERGLSVRPGTLEDIPFLDSLQKKHTKQVGWMPTKQLEGKINAGHVLVAEERSEVRDQRSGDRSEIRGERSALTSDFRPLTSAPVGYCIGNDQYFKRDDVGIIYQLNVVPDRRRGLVGATLLKAMFDRAAYGCKLFCCWCAQDIEANHFWEACGFVPLAFRTGSRSRGQRSEIRGQKTARVHIFWQRRIRPDDTSTPWWFPSQTTSGSIREDRLVLPIPPGTHWSDAKPVVLPGEQRSEVRDQKSAMRSEIRGRRSARTSDLRPPTSPASVAAGGLRFEIPREQAIVVKPKREKRVKTKNDPKHVAAARELRDRWLEKVNDDPSLLTASGKYDVSRQLQPPATDARQTRLLNAA